MAYNTSLAERIRTGLTQYAGLPVEEKKMFRGLTFMVNGKMCIGVSENNLMCRFDPAFTEEVAQRPGFQPMTMRGRQYRGYCYVDETGYTTPKDLAYWLQLCISFNDKARSSKTRK